MFNRKTKASLPAQTESKIAEEFKEFAAQQEKRDQIVSVDLAADQDGKKLIVCTVKTGTKPHGLPSELAGLEVVVTEEQEAEQEAKPSSEVEPVAKAEVAPKEDDPKVLALREAASERLAFAKSEAAQAESLRHILEQQKEENERRLADLEEMRQALEEENNDSRKSLTDIREIRRQLTSKYEQITIKESEAELAQSKAQERVELAAQSQSEAERLLSEASKAAAEAGKIRAELDREAEALGSRREDLSKREAIIIGKETEIDEMLAAAREQRQLAVETLKTVKDNKSDAERLARAAERQVKDLEKTRQETLDRNAELDAELAAAREETERSTRLKMINESEAEMLTEYESKLKAEQEELEAARADLDSKQAAADETMKAKDSEIEELSDKVDQAQSELETRAKKIEILESQIAEKDLALQQAPAEAPQEDHSEKAGQLAQTLAELVASSEAVKEDPALAARAQVVLKDLVGIIEGQAPAEIVLNGAESLVNELQV